MSWYMARENTTVFLAIAILVGALILGGVWLKVSHDNRCKPVWVEEEEGLLLPSAGGAGASRQVGRWEKPPGC